MRTIRTGDHVPPRSRHAPTSAEPVAGQPPRYRLNIDTVIPEGQVRSGRTGRRSEPGSWPGHPPRIVTVYSGVLLFALAACAGPAVLTPKPTYIGAVTPVPAGGGGSGNCSGDSGDSGGDPGNGSAGSSNGSDTSNSEGPGAENPNGPDTVTDSAPSEASSSAPPAPVEITDPEDLPDLYWTGSPDCSIAGGTLTVFGMQLASDDPAPTSRVQYSATSDSGRSGSAFIPTNADGTFLQLDLKDGDYGQTLALSVEADPAQEIRETDESNNSVSVTVEIPSSPSNGQNVSCYS